MNQFKSIRELAKVRNVARNLDSMRITSRRYHSPDATNKAERAAHAMKHDMNRALLRDEDKGLLAQVEAQSVSEITEEAIIALWQSVPRQYQANAAFYMNWATYNTLINKFRDSPYNMMSCDRTYGFQLLNKPIVFSNDMPCGSFSNEVAILYGDFRQVEVLQQGTEPIQEHECITFPGTVEVSMDGTGATAGQTSGQGAARHEVRFALYFRASIVQLGESHHDVLPMVDFIAD